MDKVFFFNSEYFVYIGGFNPPPAWRACAVIFSRIRSKMASSLVFMFILRKSDVMTGKQMCS